MTDDETPDAAPDPAPGQGKPAPHWTEEKLARLRFLCEQGASCAAIAEDLGPPITRNAVIGKMHRLKITNRVRPVGAARQGRPGRGEAGSRGRLERDLEPVIPPAVSPDEPHDGARPASLPPVPTQPGSARNVAPTDRISTATGRRRTGYAPPEPIESKIGPPPERPVFLVDLRPFQCRYPTVEVAKAVFCYCAKPTDGSSWCPEHQRVCFAPMPKLRLRGAA